MAACAAPAPTVSPEVTALEKEVAALEKKVATAEKGEAASEQEVAVLEKEIAALEKELGKAEEVVPPTPVEVITWTMFDGMSPGGSWQAKDVTVAEFTKRVELGTAGRMTLDWFHVGEHPYKNSELLRPLKEGLLDITMISPGMCYGDDPRLVSRVSLPFFTPGLSFELAREINQALVDEGIAGAIFDDWNGTHLIFCYWGSQRIYTAFPMVPPDYLTGRKIRCSSPTWGKLITLLGGEPLYIAWGEVYTALATGLVEGVQTSFVAAYGTGLIEIADHVCWTALSTPSELYVLANKDSLAALPSDVRGDLIATLEDLEEWYMAGEGIATLLALEEALAGGAVANALPPDKIEWIRTKTYEEIWVPELDKCGDPAWETFDALAKIVIDMGYEVPGYTPK